MFKDDALRILRDLSLKLTLLRTERKSVDRKKIIDNILLSDEGEMKQLEKLLSEKRK